MERNSPVKDIRDWSRHRQRQQQRSGNRSGKPKHPALGLSFRSTYGADAYKLSKMEKDRQQPFSVTPLPPGKKDIPRKLREEKQWQKEKRIQEERRIMALAQNQRANPGELNAMLNFDRLDPKTSFNNLEQRINLREVESIRAKKGSGPASSKSPKLKSTRSAPKSSLSRAPKLKSERSASRLNPEELRKRGHSEDVHPRELQAAATFKGRVKDQLDQVSGLYIPGGQDVPRGPGAKKERFSRELYEQALVCEARNRGMPTLGICGGSRSVLRAYGGQETGMSAERVRRHQRRKTDVVAHPLELRPHTFLGGTGPTVAPSGKTLIESGASKTPSKSKRSGTSKAPSRSRRSRASKAPRRSLKVSQINSTHEKLARTDTGDATGNLTGVPIVPGTMLQQQPNTREEVIPPPLQPRPEMVISARDPGSNTPEGFETSFGAPVVGITSHPEAIFGASRARENFGRRNRDAINWSQNVFRAFGQSMHTYRKKQQVNQEIKDIPKEHLRNARTA